MSRGISSHVQNIWALWAIVSISQSSIDFRDWLYTSTTMFLCHRRRKDEGVLGWPHFSRRIGWMSLCVGPHTENVYICMSSAQLGIRRPRFDTREESRHEGCYWRAIMKTKRTSTLKVVLKAAVYFWNLVNVCAHGTRLVHSPSWNLNVAPSFICAM